MYKVFSICIYITLCTSGLLGKYLHCSYSVAGSRKVRLSDRDCVSISSGSKEIGICGLETKPYLAKVVETYLFTSSGYKMISKILALE